MPVYFLMPLNVPKQRLILSMHSYGNIAPRIYDRKNNIMQILKGNNMKLKFYTLVLFCAFTAVAYGSNKSKGRARDLRSRRHALIKEVSQISLADASPEEVRRKIASSERLLALYKHPKCVLDREIITLYIRKLCAYHSKQMAIETDYNTKMAANLRERKAQCSGALQQKLETFASDYDARAHECSRLSVHFAHYGNDLSAKAHKLEAGRMSHSTLG